MNQASTSIISEVTHLNEENFESTVTHSNKPVLVDFWATWCQPCHQIAPTIEALAKDCGDRVVVAKVDVDDNPTTAQKYDIRSIPTVLLFKNGEILKRWVGVQSKETLASALDIHI